MSSYFTPDTLRFLRSLKRNNRRDWFQPRKDKYDAHVRAPMLALIDQLAVDFRKFAPEMVASPKTSMYRIYRDTRFSDDKTPYKIQAAASFRWRGLDKGRGAGLYVEVGPSWTWMGGGFYAPESQDLVRIREHIADTWPKIHKTVRTSAFTRAFGALDGEALTRVPRGYPKDHPAAEYLKHKNFLAGREFPPEFATGLAFYPTLVATFKACMPLVRFLNEPLARDSPLSS